MTKHLRNPNPDWGYTLLTTQADFLWLDEGLKFGYRLPRPAPGWLRRWGFRHLRWLWRAARIEIDALTYAKIGVRMDGRDAWVCYAIGKGWV
jgi:hypothetical protein